MIRWTLCILTLMAAPASGQSLATFEGRWQGEGRFAYGAEPDERFRCQLRVTPQPGGETYMAGRCATAQAGQSFAYRLRAEADGGLRAQSEEIAPDDLPDVLTGRLTDASLTLTNASGAALSLTRDGPGLRLVVTGRDSRGAARGEALLTRRD